MTSNNKVLRHVPEEELVRLKSDKLGRHYHRIPSYIKELSAKRPQVIAEYFLRNYRIRLELAEVTVHEHRAEPAECLYQTPLGQVGFTIERPLLTELLECYYGGTAVCNREAAPVTTSEQRLRERLATDVIDLFSRLLLAGESFGELASVENCYEEVHWEYVAEFRYKSPVTETFSSIFLYLDAQLVDELTHRLAKPMAPRPDSPVNSEITDLPVQLNCVLASLHLPLSQVLQLRPGNILTTRLFERCEVEINQQRLFRGVIFEEDGALLLTSLESVTTS